MNTRDVRICFIGDSYVQGTGDPECLGWAGRLCVNARRAGHDLTYYNLGVRRETSADIARRWHAECACRLLPTTENYVVFSFGANDAARVEGVPRIGENDTLANLRDMLAAAKTRYHTLVVGPPAADDDEHNARLARLSARMQDEAARLGIPYVATLPVLVLDLAWRDEVRTGDGAHPGARGYARLAEVVTASGAWWFGSE